MNDATAWASLLATRYKFPKANVKLITDAQATKRNIMAAIKHLLAGAKPGDVLVFTNSSHGSYVADKDGAEETYDGILCPFDIDTAEIRDDELRELFGATEAGVNLTVILDNCFSGTAIGEIIPGLHTPDDQRIRFLSPALRGLPVLQNPWTARPKASMKHVASKMKEVLLTGCTDKEYS